MHTTPIIWRLTLIDCKELALCQKYFLAMQKERMREDFRLLECKTLWPVLYSLTKSAFPFASLIKKKIVYTLTELSFQGF
jgi:hypothetical protein